MLPANIAIFLKSRSRLHGSTIFKVCGASKSCQIRSKIASKIKLNFRCCLFSLQNRFSALPDIFLPPRGPILGAPGASCGRLGRSRAASWALLARCWALFGVSWAALGRSWLALARVCFRKFVQRSSEERFPTILARFLSIFLTENLRNPSENLRNPAENQPPSAVPRTPNNK